MGKIKDVHQIRDYDDAMQWAKQKVKEHLADISEGTNHTKVEGPRGSTFLPRHPGDFKTGTRFAIIKQFIAIGLGLLSGVSIIGYSIYALIF